MSNWTLRATPGWRRMNTLESEIAAWLQQRNTSGDRIQWMFDSERVAAIAKATLPAHPRWKWDERTSDYGLIRELIARTYPDEFHEMSARMNETGGFYRGNGAHDRVWKTESGKAEFTVPSVLNAGGALRNDLFTLITLRSNDQFNTTIYGHSDRLRGLEGDRRIPVRLERLVRGRALP